MGLFKAFPINETVGL